MHHQLTYSKHEEADINLWSHKLSIEKEQKEEASSDNTQHTNRGRGMNDEQIFLDENKPNDVFQVGIMCPGI